jgi:hypothetical protein
MQAYCDSDVGKSYELSILSSKGKFILLIFGAIEEGIDGLVVCSPSKGCGDECGFEDGFKEVECFGYSFDYGILFKRSGTL